MWDYSVSWFNQTGLSDIGLAMIQPRRGVNERRAIIQTWLVSNNDSSAYSHTHCSSRPSCTSSVQLSDWLILGMIVGWLRLDMSTKCTTLTQQDEKMHYSHSRRGEKRHPRENEQVTGSGQRGGQVWLNGSLCTHFAKSHFLCQLWWLQRSSVSRRQILFLHLWPQAHQPCGEGAYPERVNGSLAVSRALGDYEYKNVEGMGPCEQLVSPEPEITETCVRHKLTVEPDLQSICSSVIDTCLNKVWQSP